MNIKEELTKILKESVKNLGYASDSLAVTFSNRPELCDFQCNFALALSKQVGEKPYDLAEKIAKNAKKTELFEFFAVMPGFINIKLSNLALSNYCQSLAEDSNLGIEQVEKSRLVFFDYGGANIAKEMHVGHLRSPIVGEALKRLHKVMGDRVLSDTHLGDFGLQMGLTIAQLEEDGYLCEFFGGKSEKSLKDVTLDLLGDEYPKASKRKEIEPQFKKKAEDYTLFIQQKKEPFYQIYTKLHDLSVVEIKKNYENLNTTFDFYYGESDAYEFIDETLKIFEDKHLLKESNGALIVEVAEEGEHVPIPKKSADEPQRFKNPMPPAILKKHNGGDLYATTDIATILIRNRSFSPDEIVYVTDNRQSTHFKQVFRCAKKAGISPAEQKLTHVAFGTMNGKDGKPFKTRSGEVVRLKDVVSLVTEKAAEKLQENKVEDGGELARKIGVGAMKFGDLSNQVSKDYVFDIEKFLSFDGKTGPYIQYTIARINSLLGRAGQFEFGVSIQSEEERSIVLAILRLCSAYAICYENYSLNNLATATFDLASAFSSLYNNQKILSEKDRARRNSLLSLCQLVKNCLEKALWTLGIESVEKM